MRPMTPALVFMSILWVLGGSYLLSGLFCPVGAAAGAATTSNLSFIDGDFKAATTGNYSFRKSTAAIAITKDAKEDYFKKTGTYLGANPEKMLALTGLYSLTENNGTDFENLGIARAEKVKDILVENGANADQISTMGEEQTDLGFIDKKLYNSVNFEVIGDETDDISSEPTLNFDESKTIYFEGDQSDLSSDDPKMTEIIDYLASYMTTNPDAIITVNGYTDNQGSNSEKLRIAKKRAVNVRRIIRDSNGGKFFPSKQVIAKAVGPQDPQADNETAEGVAINNRVTITVE